MSKTKIINKVDVPKNQKAIRRNRRNKIAGKIIACLCVLCFFAVITAGIFGGLGMAEKLWNDNIGYESGVLFNELFSILDGVTKTNESEIVTNAYDDQDLTDFYSNLKQKLYLAEDYDLNVVDILESVLSKNNTQNSTQNVNYIVQGTDGYDLEYIYTLDNGTTISSNVLLNEDVTMDDIINGDGVESDGTTGNEALDNLLKEIKFDFSSLENYDGITPNILEISDQMLAAVVNEVYSSIGDFVPQIQSIEQQIGKQIEEVLEIKQVVISGDIINPETIKLKLTIGIKANEMLSGIIDQKGLPSILKKLIPNYLYTTAIVYPNDTTKAVQASINQLSEVNVDKIISIADVILKKVGKDLSIHDLLVDVNTKIVDFIVKAQEKLPINFVNTGSVELKPIATLMNMLGVNVTEQAFLSMMRDIKLPTEESLGYDIYTQEQKDTETNEFIQELTTKYCLDNSQNIISIDNTINDIMNLAQDEQIIQKINIKDIQYSSEYIAENYKVKTSYLALANMLTSYINTPNAQGEMLLGNIKASVVTMSYNEKNAILSVDIKVDIATMLGLDENSSMANLIKQLVPSEIFATANICLDENLNIATTVQINKISEQLSKDHLATLTALAGKFGMNIQELSYENICQQIDEGIKKGFATIEEKIGCEIIFTDDSAYLPNVFEVVSGTGYLNNEEDEVKLSDEDIYFMMNQAYTYEFTDNEYNKTNNADGFINELESKYYLKDGTIVDNGDGKIFDSVMEKKDTIAEYLIKEDLAGDTRAIEEIKPFMMQEEFAYMLAHNLDLSNINSMMKSAEIVGAEISLGMPVDGKDKNLIKIYIESRLYENAQGEVGMSEEGSTDDLSKYSNLLPEYVYITVVVDIDLLNDADALTSCASLEFDGMTQKQMTDFFSVIRKLTGEDIRKENIESQIDTQVRSYLANIQDINYEFVEGGLEIDNLFNIIAQSDQLKAPEGEYVFTDIDVRSLLQSMYGYNYSEDTRYDLLGRPNYEIKNSIDGFINELYNKFFISSTFKDELIASQADNAFFDTLKQGVGGQFNTGNVRLKDEKYVDEASGQVTIIDGLVSKNNISTATQNNTIEEITQRFKPVFGIEEMAYMINTQTNILNNLSFLKEMSAVFSYNDANQLGVVIQGKGNIEDPQANALLPENIYVHININLGSILSDGTREDMTVHCLDINSIAYDKTQQIGGNSNPISELEKLMLFISRIMANTQQGGSDGGSQPTDSAYTLDKILETTESGLNEDVYEDDGVTIKSKCFKNQIHNEVYTVEFLDNNGGMRVNETIYQIVINQLYKDDKENVPPSEVAFRNALCKINNKPETMNFTSAGKEFVLDLSNTGNGAQNADNALNEIDTKYFFTENNKLAGTDITSTNILTSISAKADHYATVIDGQKMAQSESAIEELRPLIMGNELLLMLKNSLTITAKGYEGAQMISLYVTRDTVTAGDGTFSQYGEMMIIFNSPINVTGTDMAYRELLPDELALLINVDMSKLNTDEVCTSLYVNNLSNTEMQAINALFNKLTEGSETTGNEISLDLTDANIACSDSVKSTMTSLTKNMVLRLTSGETTEIDGKKVTQSGSIKLGSIFEIASNKLSDETRQVSVDELRSVLKALFAGLDMTGNSAQGDITSTIGNTQANSNNVVINLSFPTSNINGVIGDGNILSKLDVNSLKTSLGLKDLEDGTSALSIYQSALVAKDDLSYDAIRNSFGTSHILDSTKEYFLLTLQVNTQAGAGVNMTMLPENVYITTYIDLATKNIGIVYNSMTDEQMAIFSHIVNKNKGDAEGGLNTDNFEVYKQSLLDTVILDLQDYSVQFTLGDLLDAEGRQVVNMSHANVIAKDPGVVLGTGAIIFDVDQAIA